MKSPALRTLPGPAGELWRDGAVRQKRIEELRVAHDEAQWPLAEPAGKNRAQRLVESLVEDVRLGMQASGWHHSDLRRHPIRVRVTAIRPRGLALPPREIQLSEKFLARVGREETADSFIRTCVQELAHTRHVVSEDYWLETENYTGYEEGLAEGIARLLVIQDAGMHPLLGPYSHFAYAYGNLASVLRVSPTDLFSRLWQAPMGRVREWFPEVVAAILEETRPLPLVEEQTTQLRAVADELFDGLRSYDPVDEPALREAWREALR